MTPTVITLAPEEGGKSSRARTKPWAKFGTCLSSKKRRARTPCLCWTRGLANSESYYHKEIVRANRKPKYLFWVQEIHRRDCQRDGETALHQRRGRRRGQGGLMSPSANVRGFDCRPLTYMVRQVCCLFHPADDWLFSRCSEIERIENANVCEWTPACHSGSEVVGLLLLPTNLCSCFCRSPTASYSSLYLLCR
jgi:hypothetical protein